MNVFDLSSLVEETFEPMTWAIPGLVPEGCILFAGRPKLGKSWFVLQLALAVASGDNIFNDIPVEQADVLYLALEDTRRRLQSRAKRLLGERPVPSGFKFALECPRFDDGGDKQLEEWLEQNPRTKMVIIDTFQKIKIRRSSNGNFETLSRLAEIARKFKICLMVVHHTRKADAEDAFDTVSGSTETASLADAVLVLKRTRCSQMAELHITGRDIEESRKGLRFDTNTMTWEILGEADEVWKSQERLDIIHALQKNGMGMKPREIADELEKSGPAVRKILSRMVRDNQIVWAEGGKYDLKINDRRAYEDPAREVIRKERAQILHEAFREVFPDDASVFGEKLLDASEEVFNAIDLAYGANEETADAPTFVASIRGHPDSVSCQPEISPGESFPNGQMITDKLYAEGIDQFQPIRVSYPETKDQTPIKTLKDFFKTSF